MVVFIASNRQVKRHNTGGLKMKKLKAGIIGAGGIAQVAHIPNLRKMKDVELVAISDPNVLKLEAVASEFQIPLKFAKSEDLLAEELDFVIICSPNAYHASHAIAAMKSGKHVLCEKPVAMNAKETAKILETARNTRKIFMVAFVHRFAPHSKFIKNLASQGELGEIYHAKTMCLRRRGIPGPGTWFTIKRLSGGGPLIDVGVHILDLALFLMGCPRPKTVLATTCTKFNRSITDGGWPPLKTRIGDRAGRTFDVEDFAAGFITFQNGSSLMLETTWAANCEPALTLDLFGTKAGVRFASGDEKPVKVFGEIEGILTDSVPKLQEADPYQEEIAHFVECVREGKKPLTSPIEILTTAKIIEAFYRSAETGRPLTIG